MYQQVCVSPDIGTFRTKYLCACVCVCAVASNLVAAADEDAEDVGDECHDAVPVSLISLLFLFFFSLSFSLSLVNVMSAAADALRGTDTKHQHQQHQ